MGIFCEWLEIGGQQFFLLRPILLKHPLGVSKFPKANILKPQDLVLLVVKLGVFDLDLPHSLSYIIEIYARYDLQYNPFFVYFGYLTYIITVHPRFYPHVLVHFVLVPFRLDRAEQV